MGSQLYVSDNLWYLIGYMHPENSARVSLLSFRVKVNNIKENIPLFGWKGLRFLGGIEQWAWPVFKLPKALVQTDLALCLQFVFAPVAFRK